VHTVCQGRLHVHSGGCGKVTHLAILLDKVLTVLREHGVPTITQDQVTRIYKEAYREGYRDAQLDQESDVDAES